MKIYLQELFLALISRKNQDRIGGLVPPGAWSSGIYFVFLLRERPKVLEKLAANTKGDRVKNICVKNTENT